MRSAPGSPWRPRRPTLFTTRASLALVDRLRGPIAWLGVDFPVFRLILELRLRQDAVGDARRGRGQGPVGAGMVMAAVWTVLSGLGPGMIALATHEPLLWMLSGQALWILTVGFLTVTHFASTLVDPTDVAVLASRPVDDRTLFATRIAHVLAYVLLLSACAALVPTLLGLFVFPPLAVLVAYPVATACSALIVLGGVTLAIAVVLRLVGPSGFQRVVFWGQVGGAMLLIVLSQLVTRVFVRADLEGLLAGHRWLALPLPPLAEYGLYRLLAGTGDRLDLVHAAVVSTLPLVAGFLTLRVASRSFVAAVGDPGTLLGARGGGFPRGIFARLGPRVCSTREAGAAYGLALALSRRDRLYLRSVLPMMGMVAVAAFAMMVPRRSLRVDTEMAGVGLYYVLLLGASTFELSRLSEHAAAREWRRIQPVTSASALLEGSAKALLCGTLLPLLLLLAAALLGVAGPAVLGDVVLAVPLAAAALTLSAKPFLRSLPFTQGASSQAHLDRLPRFVALMLVMSLLIGLHALARRHWLPLALGSLAGVALFLRGWRGLRHWRPEPGSALARLAEEDEDAGVSGPPDRPPPRRRRRSR